jgi:hypothetical protein
MNPNSDYNRFSQGGSDSCRNLRLKVYVPITDEGDVELVLRKSSVDESV